MVSNKISVIVFDLGNVLLPFDYKIAINKLNEVGARLGEKFISFIKTIISFTDRLKKGN